MGAPSCATSSSVFVTNGKPRKGQPMRGSDNSLSAGCLRGPSPIGVIQRWAPDFRSIAVMRPYGGLLSGPAKGIVIDGTYRIPVSGSNAAPDQEAPPTAPGKIMADSIDGGVYKGPCPYLRRIASASRRSSGVKSIRSSTERPCRSNGAGFVGKGWVSELLSPGTVDCGTLRSSMGHIGFPVTRSKTKQNACLVT